jgi:hypothetical protein
MNDDRSSATVLKTGGSWSMPLICGQYDTISAETQLLHTGYANPDVPSQHTYRMTFFFKLF